MSATPNINPLKITGYPLNKFDATAAPTVNDDSADGYVVGSKWIDVTNDKAYNCVDATSGAAVWLEAGGGGNTIYTADDALAGNRTIDLLTYKLSLDGTGATGNPFQVDCKEVYTGITPYLKANLNGGISVMGSSSSDGCISAYSGHPSSQPKIFLVDRFGGGYWHGSSIVLRQNSTGSGISLTGSALHIHDVNDNIRHDIGTNTGSGNQHCKFYANGYTNSGKFIVGAAAAVSTENISLQGITLIKGEGTSTGNILELYNNDTTPVKMFEAKDNGQFGFGGAYVSANAYTFRNPAAKATIARFDDDTSNTPSFTIGTNGSLLSAQSGSAVFYSYRQSGVSYIKLFDAGTESVRFSKNGSWTTSSLLVGGATITTGARFEIQQASTNVAQQLFFANARTSTAGRLGSDGSFGTDQKGLECYDTDLNKKFFWNGSAWEQLVSGGATSGIGTKVLVQGKMDTTQSVSAATDTRIDYVDTGGIDINGEWDNTNHKFVVGSSGAGVYQIMNSIFIQNNAGWSRIFIKKNGTTVDYIYGSEFENAASSWEGLNGHWNIELAAGDEIEFWMHSTTAFSFSSTWYDHNVFQITKIGDSVTVNNVVAQTLNKTFTLQEPTASEDITVFRTDVAITVQEVIACSTGTSPDTTYQLKHHTDRSNAGNALTTSAATTSTTTGDTASLDDATIPANSWVWLETTAASGTSVYLSIDIRYTED